MKRQRLVDTAVTALATAFGAAVVVSDNPLLKFDASEPHLIVWVAGDSVPADPDTDGNAMVDVDLMVRSTSVVDDSQRQLNDRFEKVQDVLVNEDFLAGVGGVSATYVGYEFEIDDGFAEGTSTYSFSLYDEVGV